MGKFGRIIRSFDKNILIWRKFGEKVRLYLMIFISAITFRLGLGLH